MNYISMYDDTSCATVCQIILYYTNTVYNITILVFHNNAGISIASILLLISHDIVATDRK